MTRPTFSHLPTTLDAADPDVLGTEGRHSEGSGGMVLFPSWSPIRHNSIAILVTFVSGRKMMVLIRV